METWSFYSAGIRIARWPAAGTLEWACLVDRGRRFGRARCNERRERRMVCQAVPVFARGHFLKGLSAWNKRSQEAARRQLRQLAFLTAVRMDFTPSARARFPKDILFADGAVRAQRSSSSGTTVLVQDGWGTRPRARENCLCACRTASMPVRALGTLYGCRAGCGKAATDVYVPGNARSPVPVMLVRTPHDKTAAPWNYFNFVRRGLRSSFRTCAAATPAKRFSALLPLRGGGRRRHAELARRRQEWSNGRVGMIGGSYLGYVQWCAAASGNPAFAGARQHGHGGQRLCRHSPPGRF